MKIRFKRYYQKNLYNLYLKPLSKALRISLNNDEHMLTKLFSSVQLCSVVFSYAQQCSVMFSSVHLCSAVFSRGVVKRIKNSCSNTELHNRVFGKSISRTALGHLLACAD